MHGARVIALHYFERWKGINIEQAEHGQKHAELDIDNSDDDDRVIRHSKQVGEGAGTVG